MKTKIILASLAILGSIELSAYTYEVNPLIGKNFTESGSLVDDSTAYGIRLNRYISEDNAIMFGYTRINDADYKKRKAASKAGRYNTSTNGTCTSNGTCGKEVPATNTCATAVGCGNNGTGNANGGNNGAGNANGGNNGAGNANGGNNGAGNANGGNNGAGNANGGNNGAGNANGGNNGAGNANNGAGNANNGAGNANGGTGTGTGGTVIPTPGAGIGNLGNAYTGDTDINRFYINGLHNIHTRFSRLTPYVYGGFGYEHVSDELKDNDSQGFFNAGGGLKFNLTDRFNLLADVQGIKKFSNHDLDILGSLGIGFLFGNAFQPAPEAVVASGLEDVTPVAPVRKVTVVQVTPQPIAEPIIQAPMGEYYVQMAAGFKTDMVTDCKHTRDLQNAGIDYDIKYTTIRGKNAAIVVVGPYETKEEAKSHLSALRKYSKDAFIKRIKD